MNTNYSNQLLDNDTYYIFQDAELLDLQMEEAERLIAAEGSDYSLDFTELTFN